MEEKSCAAIYYQKAVLNSPELLRFAAESGGFIIDRDTPSASATRWYSIYTTELWYRYDGLNEVITSFKPPHKNQKLEQFEFIPTIYKD